jgi:Zn-dependent peptidase ImmA (M78 family)
MNTYELAKYFGCSNDTISRRLKENGIHPKKFYEDLTG